MQAVETLVSQPNTQETTAESRTIETPDEKELQAPRWHVLASKLHRRFGRVESKAFPEPPEANATQPSSEEAEPGVPLMSNAGDFNPLPAQVEQSDKSSIEIFAEIGAGLRQRREMLSLTVEEVERHTRIKAAFLTSLEKGALEELPSPVQTRGILANYAAFLDLDADAILLRFADVLQVGHRERGPGKTSRTRAPMNVNTSLPPWRSFIASDLLFGGGMAIMLLLFAVWGISRVMSVRSSVPLHATSLSISDVLAGTALPTLAQEVTLIAAQATPLASDGSATATLQLPTLAANVKVQVTLTVAESTYMRVTVDGKVQFDGRAELGRAYSYQAAKQIEVLVGNAAALRVTYNGRDQGLMGNFGEVIDRVYTAGGVVTPTSTRPPTPTFTPKITATPSPTPTRTPTRAPTATPGE